MRRRTPQRRFGEGLLLGGLLGYNVGRRRRRGRHHPMFVAFALLPLIVVLALVAELVVLTWPAALIILAVVPMLVVVALVFRRRDRRRRRPPSWPSGPPMAAPPWPADHQAALEAAYAEGFRHGQREANKVRAQAWRSVPAVDPDDPEAF